MSQKRTESEWRAILKDQQDSDLTKQEYCQQKDIKLASFYYWQRKVRQEQRTVLPLFRPIQIVGSHEIQLRTSQGNWIELQSHSAETLAKIISHLPS